MSAAYSIRTDTTLDFSQKGPRQQGRLSPLQSTSQGNSLRAPASPRHSPGGFLLLSHKPGEPCVLRSEVTSIMLLFVFAICIAPPPPATFAHAFSSHAIPGAIARQAEKRIGVNGEVVVRKKRKYALLIVMSRPHC